MVWCTAAEGRQGCDYAIRLIDLQKVGGLDEGRNEINPTGESLTRSTSKWPTGFRRLWIYMFKGLGYEYNELLCLTLASHE